MTSVTRLVLAVSENSAFIPVSGGAYKEGEVGQPIAVNPLISQNQPDLDVSALVYAKLSDLITTYDESKDGRVYTLKLKEGMKWSDNEPLASDDVIFTIQTIQDPDARSPLAKNWQGVVAERVSELQVKLNLPAPYAFFADNIDNLLVLPKHIFGTIPPANLTLSEYNLEPVASGPYRFENLIKRKDGFITDYVLTTNQNFPGAAPYIKDFYFKFFSSTDDLLNALKLRQINGYGSLTLLPTVLDGLSNLKIENIPMPRYYAIFMNQNVNPSLKNAGLRQALLEAVDKDEINKAIFGGAASVIQSPFFTTSTTAASSSADFNLADAQKLIGNFKKNNKLTLNLVVPQIDFLQKTADLIKKDWLAAGVDEVDVTALTPDDLMNNVLKARNYELLLFGNALENPMDLFPFWHSSGRFYPGLNLAIYQNSKVDNYLEAVRETTDPSRAQTYLQNAVNLILADNPAIFLFSLPYTYVHTSNLSGFAFANGDQFLITPADRFQNVNQWSVAKARILK